MNATTRTHVRILTAAEKVAAEKFGDRIKAANAAKLAEIEARHIAAAR